MPCAILSDNIPSVGDAFGAIGTPPPSARRFIAAAKIILFILCTQWLSPHSSVTSAVFIEKSEETVSKRYVSFPRWILFKTFFNFECNAFLQTIASRPIPELIPKIRLSSSVSPQRTSPKSTLGTKIPFFSLAIALRI